MGQVKLVAKGEPLSVLNVGGGTHPLPPTFDGWESSLLDIDPAVEPDWEISATAIRDEIAANQYDAVWCSHNLEHVYAHEVPIVLEGFAHVLKPRGFVLIAVPDIGALVQAMQGKDISDAWYMAPGDTPISFHDVLFGWDAMMRKGNLYYAHKTGFTQRSLDAAMRPYFDIVHIARDGFNLSALGIKCR